MEQKTCAACGKLFHPKGRERYCDGPHYKPCPVCGEQVLAVYWSDPPKRCEKCRAANAKVAKPVEKLSQTAETKVNTTSDDNITRTVDLGEDNNVRRYSGPEGKGIPFKNGHVYILVAEKEEKYGSYIITSKYDVTAEEDIDAYMRYSSMLMIDQRFQKVSD